MAPPYMVSSPAVPFLVNYRPDSVGLSASLHPWKGRKNNSAKRQKTGERRLLLIFADHTVLLSSSLHLLSCKVCFDDVRVCCLQRMVLICRHHPMMKIRLRQRWRLHLLMLLHLRLILLVWSVCLCPFHGPESNVAVYVVISQIHVLACMTLLLQSLLYWYSFCWGMLCLGWCGKVTCVIAEQSACPINYLVTNQC